MAYCSKCGASISDEAVMCPHCGASVGGSYHRSDAVPTEYAPLSPWAYFGYEILFAIPLVGLICLIIFSFNNSNINRRNFARSFFCVYVIAIIIIVIVVVVAGGSLAAIFAGSLD